MHPALKRKLNIQEYFLLSAGIGMLAGVPLLYFFGMTGVVPYVWGATKLSYVMGVLLYLKND
jgi:hypothetical protein